MTKDNKFKKNLKNNKELVFFVLLFLIITMISYFFPITHDDWDWGSTFGIERLQNGFDDYNGRWAGNILIIVLSRFRLLRAFSISITLSLIVMLIRKFINCTKDKSLFTILLLIIMPTSVLAQAIAWTSGFVNYVVPVMLLLIYMYFNKNIFSKEKTEIKKIFSAPLLALGFINSLFMENLTIYNFILSIVVVVYLFIKEKKVDIPNFMYMIGSFGGTILMFSNSAYKSIFSSTDSYRSIEQGNIIVRSLKTYFGQIYHLLVNNNVALNIILCILLLLVVYKFYKNHKKCQNKIIDFLLKFSTFIIIGYLSYITYIRIVGGSNIFIYPTYKKYMEGMMMLAYAFAIVVIISVVINDKYRKSRIIFEIVSIILMTVPLLIVSPIGPRNFFPTYVFFVIIALELFNYLISELNIDLLKTIGPFITFLIICLFSIYGYVYKVEQERLDYLYSHQNDAVIVLPRIPFANYMQFPDPKNEYFMGRFKDYYNVNEKMEIELMEYKKWKRELEK